MKVVCISISNHYTSRMEAILSIFESLGCDTEYLIGDFNHFRKDRVVEAPYHATQIHVPSYRKNLSVSRLVSHYLFAKRVYKKLIELKPDIIYSIVPPNSLFHFIRQYKSKYPCKVIFDNIDLWPEGFPYETKSKLINVPFGIWRGLRSRNIACADWLFCVSRGVNQTLQTLYPETPRSLLYPVLTGIRPVNYTAQTDEQVSICYLGSINHLFDTDLNLTLLHAIRKKKKVVMHIIGQGEKLPKFVEAAQRQGIHIECHGAIFNPEEKAKVYAQCNFSILLYQEAAHVDMPLKVVEYLAVGLPVITNAFSDIRSIVETYRAGIITSRDTLRETADIICGLTSEESVQMHENCLVAYQKFFAQQNLFEVMKTIIQ